MDKLDAQSLYKLEDYARERTAFRARVIAHKKLRTLALGPHLTLVFEDRLTIQYQVQEMLRIERIFEPAGIADELAAYNPLIPDGTNLKATLLIEYPDVEQRRHALARLHGVERAIRLEVDGRVAATTHADEDLERADADKTSAVHFLRFELEPAAIAALRGGAGLAFAVDHAHYTARVELDAARRAALAADFA